MNLSRETGVWLAKPCAFSWLQCPLGQEGRHQAWIWLFSGHRCLSCGLCLYTGEGQGWEWLRISLQQKAEAEIWDWNGTNPFFCPAWQNHCWNSPEDASHCSANASSGLLAGVADFLLLYWLIPTFLDSCLLQATFSLEKEKNIKSWLHKSASYKTEGWLNYSATAYPCSH